MIDEEMTGWLLRLGGMRPDVSREVEARVKRAFLDECRAVARARVIRRRLTLAAVSLATAALVLVAMRVWMPREVVVAPAATVAMIERVDGEATRTGNGTTVVRLGDNLRAGDAIEVGEASRLSLRLSNGVSLRVDRTSRLRLASSTRIALDEGSVYVDSGSTSAPGLDIATPLGIVRDIGTQFETRVRGAELRVRVRSGIVEVHRDGDVSAARSGTELTVESGQVTSRALAPYGSEWAWAESLGPGFAIEGRTLAAFLDYICREQGWTLAYGDPALARQASGIILHGSTAGLQAPDALAVVLRTSGLTHRLADGQLEVSRAARP